MKKENVIFLKTSFIAGTFLAFVMTAYGYFNEEENLVWKFIIHFFLLGNIMGFFARRRYIKKQKELDPENNKKG